MGVYLLWMGLDQKTIDPKREIGVYVLISGVKVESAKCLAIVFSILQLKNLAVGGSTGSLRPTMQYVAQGMFQQVLYAA